MLFILCDKGEEAGKKGQKEPIFSFVHGKQILLIILLIQGQLQTALNNLKFSEAVDCLSTSSWG